MKIEQAGWVLVSPTQPIASLLFGLGNVILNPTFEADIKSVVALET